MVFLVRRLVAWEYTYCPTGETIYPLGPVSRESRLVRAGDDQIITSHIYPRVVGQYYSPMQELEQLGSRGEGNVRFISAQGMGGRRAMTGARGLYTPAPRAQ
jgi:hypothetical protein